MKESLRIKNHTVENIDTMVRYKIWRELLPEVVKSTINWDVNTRTYRRMEDTVLPKLHIHIHINEQIRTYDN